MLKSILAATFSLFLVTEASALCTFTYGGERCPDRPSIAPRGETTITGTSKETGNIYSHTYERGGDQRGTDRFGNRWQFDRDTGIYNNYDTGETRYKGRRY